MIFFSLGYPISMPVMDDEGALASTVKKFKESTVINIDEKSYANRFSFVEQCDVILPTLDASRGEIRYRYKSEIKSLKDKIGEAVCLLGGT